MTTEQALDLDMALARLARREAELAPEPSAALIERVLADAARSAPPAILLPARESANVVRMTPRTAALKRAPDAAPSARIWVIRAAAAVAMAACLTAGLGIGYVSDMPELQPAGDEPFVQADLALLEDPL